MPRPESPVTACIPYYKGKRYIRRAVQSLLSQTHGDLQVIVVNDGDCDPPWADLMSMRDPRLVCFDLQRNHGGPFFAYAVVANTVTSTWFLIQEQDDWSDPRRLQQLLHLAVARSADVVHRVGARVSEHGRAANVGRPVACALGEGAAP